VDASDHSLKTECLDFLTCYAETVMGNLLESCHSPNPADAVPVTVLTGFLGSGKTTLLNRVIRENHGKGVAVIVNVLGEVSVDQELIVGAGEGLFERTTAAFAVPFGPT
jgi:CobW/HypB/UreG, nucleotide-binding domain